MNECYVVYDYRGELVFDEIYDEEEARILANDVFGWYELQY